MDRDHRHHFFSQRPILKKRYSFDVTLLEADTLFLAHDRNRQDHSGTETSNSAPTSVMSYPFVSAQSDPITTTTTTFSATAPQYQSNRSLQNNNHHIHNGDEEQENDYQQQPEGFVSHDDFVLFRHPHSPQVNSNGHSSPSTFPMSPSSSLILDNLFPDLSSLL